MLSKIARVRLKNLSAALERASMLAERLEFSAEEDPEFARISARFTDSLDEMSMEIGMLLASDEDA